MMQRVIRKRGLMVRGGITWIGVTALVAINAATLAQTVTKSPQDPNQKQVFLIRKDTAECSGSDVPNVDSPLVGGNVVVARLGDGTTRAEVAMTPSDPGTAVCVLPGTELAFNSEIAVYGACGPTRYKTAIFRQVNREHPHMHHDALELPDGQTLLLTFLCEGQEATVLQLPAKPMTREEERVAIAG